MENKKNIINTIDSFKVVGNLNNNIAYIYYGALFLFLFTFFILSLPIIFKKLVTNSLLEINLDYD
jgi:hypothetical protein